MGQTSDHLAWDPDGCTKLDSYLRLWLGPLLGVTGRVKYLDWDTSCNSFGTWASHWDSPEMSACRKLLISEHPAWTVWGGPQTFLCNLCQTYSITNEWGADCLGGIFSIRYFGSFCFVDVMNAKKIVFHGFNLNTVRASHSENLQLLLVHFQPSGTFNSLLYHILNAPSLGESV